MLYNPKMKINIWEIYKIFFKIGAILIGGGYVILPILKDEVVDKKNWITEDELIDYFAISQSLPGLIAANISIFIGYKKRGKTGAIVATLGMITAPMICIICLSTLIAQISEYHFVQVFLSGVGIGVIALIISSVQEIWSKAIVDKFSLFMFLLFVSTTFIFNLKPTPIILASIIIGIIYKSIQQKRKEL